MSSGSITPSTGVQYGTNVPPISFPGISSGLDYNSIIKQLTLIALEPTIGLNQQIATLNAANTELIKIDNLFNAVQTALAGLSQPILYNGYDAISSNLSAANAQGISGQTATPGTYTIQSETTATATTVTSNASAGHSITDLIGGTPSQNVPLIDSYAAVTPQNSASGGNGSFTVDGVTIAFNVTSDSLSTVLSRLQTAVQAVDPGFTATLNATGQVTLASTDKPISIGSSTDQGNLLAVLKLDSAQLVNTGISGTITSTSNIGGINQALDFNSTNPAGQVTDANVVTPVTSGSFTINGVSINVNTNDNLAAVISRINASAAGVTASYNADTNQVTLTSKSSGPQSIVVGSSGDTSNFLSAVGLSGAGATTSIGTQAKVVVQNPGGGTSTYYSNTNAVTTAIPGIQLNLVSNSATPFTVSVSQDSTSLVSAANAFVSAYNAAITEINTATAPPTVLQTNSNGLPGQIATAQSFGAGVLYGNTDISLIQEQLTNIVSGIIPGSGSSYNSLSQIGITLDSSVTQVTASAQTPGSTASPLSTQSLDGTDGLLAPLNTSKLLAAFTANPNAVQTLLNGSFGLTQQLGGYLTGVTGLPTLLSGGIAGSIPQTSLLQNFENSITSQIQTIQQQVNNITGEANLQADLLRSEYAASESLISGYQSLQSQLGSFFKSSGS